MKQRKVPEQPELKKNGSYERTVKNAMTSYAGMDFTYAPRNTFDDTPKERRVRSPYAGCMKF